MRAKRLELIRLAALEPKSSASANSATGASTHKVYHRLWQIVNIFLFKFIFPLLNTHSMESYLALRAVKNIFNQLKDEETLQGYAD